MLALVWSVSNNSPTNNLIEKCKCKPSDLEFAEVLLCEGYNRDHSLVLIITCRIGEVVVWIHTGAS
jgi:hypothetical protein